MARMLNFLRLAQAHVLFVLSASVIQVGCSRVGGYPEATITTPVGHEGLCVACSKKISSVSKANLVTIDGIQFIVCDEACAKKAEGIAERSHSH